MRSSFFSMLVFLGTILLSFGFVILVIEFLAEMNGARHDIARILAIGCLVGGAILAAAGTFGGRSRRSSANDVR